MQDGGRWGGRQTVDCPTVGAMHPTLLILPDERLVGALTPTKVGPGSSGLSADWRASEQPMLILIVRRDVLVHKRDRRL